MLLGFANRHRAFIASRSHKETGIFCCVFFPFGLFSFLFGRCTPHICVFVCLCFVSVLFTFVGRCSWVCLGVKVVHITCTTNKCNTCTYILYLVVFLCLLLISRFCMSRYFACVRILCSYSVYWFHVSVCRYLICICICLLCTYISRFLISCFRLYIVCLLVLCMYHVRCVHVQPILRSRAFIVRSLSPCTCIEAAGNHTQITVVINITGFLPTTITFHTRVPCARRSGHQPLLKIRLILIYI